MRLVAEKGQGFMNMREGSKFAIEEIQISSFREVEDIIERKFEDIVTILGSDRGQKSNLYDDILLMVEKTLIKIAMRRSNNIKTSAADFLGINRNTLSNKINKFNMNNGR